jgi:putative transposase
MRENERNRHYRVMARQARVVLPGIAYHCTQRGTDGRKVFFRDRDRRIYLRMLGVFASQARLRVLAYCLMTNHVHLVVIPEESDSLATAFRRCHGRYAQLLNTLRGRTGHLWQSRFFSCPMDESHLWAAIRYTEHNPVRAGVVARPDEYRWSRRLQACTCSGRPFGSEPFMSAIERATGRSWRREARMVTAVS